MIILTPLSEQRNILLLSSSPSQRFSYYMKDLSGMTRWPRSNIFSNLSSHLIWALCGQPDPRLWLKFSTIISARDPASCSSDKLTFFTGDTASLGLLLAWSSFLLILTYGRKLLVISAVIWTILMISLANICLWWVRSQSDRREPGWWRGQLSNATTGHLGARNEELNNSNDKMRGSLRLML